MGRLPSSLTRVEGHESSEKVEKISNVLWKNVDLWKDADPDIPILIAAKAEYAKLK